MTMIRIVCLIAALAVAVPVAPAFANQALGLDGADALAREGVQGSPSPLDVPTFTVEAWVFPDLPGRTMNVASDSGYVLQICANGECIQPGVSGIELFLFKVGVNEPVLAGVAGAAGTANAINFGQWNHIAASYNSATDQCTLSVNGNVTVLNDCLGEPLDVAFDQRFGIGVRDAGTQSGAGIDTAGAFAGQISAVRFSNSVRYTADFTPACPVDDAATLGLWLFHDPLGATSFADSSGAGRTLTGLNGAAIVNAAAGIPCGGGGGGQSTRNDFNGDGQTDILWRNVNTDVVSLWLMDGPLAIDTPNLGLLDPAVWEVLGLGDLDGDSNTDILWRNLNTGLISLWRMNGGVLAAPPENVDALSPATWRALGLADFDGDGRTDILWRNANTGVVSLWLMNGSVASSTPNLGILDPAVWEVLGLDDLDGDGNADILWRNLNTGVVSLWRMNGGVLAGPPQNVDVLPAATWQALGLGDLNGDGRADILWRNLNTGVVSLWLMNGNVATSATNLGILDPSVWTTIALGDFNGDVRTDILWRTAGGSIVLWLMNGGTVLEAHSLGNLVPAWVLESAN